MPQNVCQFGTGPEHETVAYISIAPMARGAKPAMACYRCWRSLVGLDGNPEPSEQGYVEALKARAECPDFLLALE